MLEPNKSECNNTIRPIDWWITHCWLDCENCTENTCSNKTLSDDDRNYCDEAIEAIMKLYDREKRDLEDKACVLVAQIEFLAGIVDFSLLQDRLADAGIDFWREMKNTPRDIKKAVLLATRRDSEPEKPEHRCGIMGFNQMLGDVCPACEAKNTNEE